MPIWTCPACEREFGAVGRSHVCEPGVSLEEFLAGAVDVAGPVTRRIVEHLHALDEDTSTERQLIVDPLPNMLLLKQEGTFATVQPMTKWVAVGFSLGRKLESDRLGRKVQSQGRRHYHVVNVDDPGQVDDELLGWLTEAFLGDDVDIGATGTDPMVPDDVDVEIAPPPWQT